MACKPGNRALNRASVEEGCIRGSQRTDITQGKMDTVKATLLESQTPWIPGRRQRTLAGTLLQGVEAMGTMLPLSFLPGMATMSGTKRRTGHLPPSQLWFIGNTGHPTQVRRGHPTDL